jgi:hypothetical protein
MFGDLQNTIWLIHWRSQELFMEGGSANLYIFNLITIILTTICIDIGIFKSG